MNFDPIETHIFDFQPSQAPFELVRAQTRLYAPPKQHTSNTLATHGLYAPPPPDRDAGACEAGAKQLLGHYTPHYIYHPFSPFLAAQSFPQTETGKMKFVVLLREPGESVA